MKAYMPYSDHVPSRNNQFHLMMTQYLHCCTLLTHYTVSSSCNARLSQLEQVILITITLIVITTISLQNSPHGMSRELRIIIPTKPFWWKRLWQNQKIKIFRQSSTVTMPWCQFWSRWHSLYTLLNKWCNLLSKCHDHWSHRLRWSSMLS